MRWSTQRVENHLRRIVEEVAHDGERGVRVAIATDGGVMSGEIRRRAGEHHSVHAAQKTQHVRGLELGVTKRCDHPVDGAVALRVDRELSHNPA